MNTLPALVQSEVIVSWGIQEVPKPGAGENGVCSALLFQESFSKGAVMCAAVQEPEQGVLLLGC